MPAGLSPAAYAILACIAGSGPSTPYELAKSLDETVGPLWSFPHSQLYGVPERLARQGLVDESREQSGRRRRVFSLTDAGREALEGWLRQPEPGPALPRDPALLKLLFARSATGSRSLEELLASQEQAAREHAEGLRRLSEELARGGHRHPLPEAVGLAARYADGVAELWATAARTDVPGGPRRHRDQPSGRGRLPRGGPPLAARRPHRLVAHDDVRVDDWLWLRQKDDPQVRAYLAAENAWMEGETEHLGALRERLFREIVGRIQETDLSVPVRKGPWAYYSRTVEGLDYAIHCRRAAWAADGGSPPAEQVLLDENAAAAGSAFFALGGFAVSPDHRLAAWSFDAAGGERYELRLRDLDSGEDLPERIPDTYYGLAWASDSSTILYTRPDAAMRPWQVLAHRLGTPVDDDRIVHEEPDERFFVGLATTKDEQLLLVELQSQVTSEVRLLRAERPGDEPVVVEPRRQGIEYSVEHWGRRLLITTNDGAESFRLMWAPEDDPGRGAWRELLPCDPDVKLDGIDVMERHLLLYERAGGVRRIRSARLQGAGEVVAGSLRVVDQPEAVSTAWGSGNVEMATSTLRYEYTSLVTPRSVYDYDLDTGQATLLKRQPVLGDFDARRYRTWRLWAKAPDGTEIPVSVVARADTEADGTAPCLLYGYGAYEHSVEPTFSAMRLSLLDRGVVYAIAHVRGGGELGRHWYTDGKLLAKRNTFDDFVAAARHLVDSGWASPERLVARGASAGGLLMGAVANLAPEIFAGIVAQVPFVDCLTTISDETLPLTVIEWEEWGNPIADRAVYEYMKSYSPYDNVRSVQYPRMLVTAGLEDPRVGYWEPAKWVAKLRRQSPQSRILLKTEMGAGHMGPSGRYDSWREEAFVQAFVLDVLGLAQAEDDAPTDVNAKS